MSSIRFPWSSTVVVLGAAVLAAVVRPAGADPEILASASFESDSVGATAKPDGTPTVAEDVWDASSCSGGASGVVSSGSTMRYRLSDVGTEGGVRGIRLPLSTEVTGGTAIVEAVATAEQTDREGGTLALEDPEESKWTGLIGFGSDGKFRVHGSGTNVSYTANVRYRFTVTVHFGESPTADYTIVDLSTSQTVLESTNRAIYTGESLAAVSFCTGGEDDGAFTVDEVMASR
jgi:hypothetical protein